MTSRTATGRSVSRTAGQAMPLEKKIGVHSEELDQQAMPPQASARDLRKDGEREWGTRMANAATHTANASGGDAGLHAKAAAAHKDAAQTYASHAVMSDDPEQKAVLHAISKQHMMSSATHSALQNGQIVDAAAGVARAFQTGAKGGQFTTTATGRRVYKKQ